AGDLAFAALAGASFSAARGEALLMSLGTRFAWALDELLRQPPGPDDPDPSAFSRALAAALTPAQAGAAGEASARGRQPGTALPPLLNRYPGVVRPLLRQLAAQRECPDEYLAALAHQLETHPAGAAAGREWWDELAGQRPRLAARRLQAHGEARGDDLRTE